MHMTPAIRLATVCAAGLAFLSIFLFYPGSSTKATALGSSHTYAKHVPARHPSASNEGLEDLLISIQ